jgi:hypothetical protein
MFVFHKTLLSFCTANPVLKICFKKEAKNQKKKERLENIYLILKRNQSQKGLTWIWEKE